MNQNICNNCGGEYEYRGGRWICRACGAYRPTEISNEEVTLLYTAYQNLRLAEFDAAEKEFDDIIQKYPQNPNGYWGRLMARYGIKYERDFDGRMIPTCYATSIESVISSSDYKKALEYADKDTREYYRRQAEYVERVRREWVEKASREKPYDIFISYKDSDLANGIDRTQDSVEMQELYIHLTNKGYRVFFSRESLRDKVGEKYEPYIFSALSTARVMLVYGSKPEYITSTWLKNEWTRYEKRIQAGEKKPDSLLVACDGFSPAELPRELSSRQCFNASAKSFYSDLDEALERLFRAPKKKATATEPIFRDVEPEAVKPEEKKKKSFVPFIFIGLFLLICGFAVFALMGGSLGSTPDYEASTTGPDHIWVPGVNGSDGGKDDGGNSSNNCEHKIVTEQGWEPNCKDWGYSGREYCELCGMTLRDREDIPPSPELHKFPEGADLTQVLTCTYCGESVTPWEGTEGLAFKEDGDGYIFTGLGTATDTVIYIPRYYNDKPVWAIDANAFKDQAQLTAIYIPDTVNSIGPRAFYGCTGLTSFTIPVNVSEIKAQAFYRCDNLKTLYINFNHALDDNTYLKQSSIEKIVFQGRYASQNLSGVTSVKELVFTNAVEAIHFVGGSSSVTKVTIGENVKEIAGDAFNGTTSLAQIILPESLESLGPEAFVNCTALEKINLPEGLKRIEAGVFLRCTALTEIVLPDSLTEIGDMAFMSSGITSIIIPESVMVIGSSAFDSCKSLKTVVLPDGITEIPSKAFYGCSSLTSVTIPESVYTIWESAFKECTALKTVTIPLDVAEIQASAFEGCCSLVEVINHSLLELKAGETSHGYVAYYALDVHDGESKMVETEDYIFYLMGDVYRLVEYKGSATEVALPDQFNGKNYTIGGYAFVGRSDITSITVPETVQEIGEGAFAGCSGLVRIDLPFVGANATGNDQNNEITNLHYIFRGEYAVPENLTSVTIRGGVIGECAFSGWDYFANIEEIILGEGVTKIGQQAFDGCESLTELVIPNSVTEISYYAFSGCKSLVSLTVPFIGIEGGSFFWHFFGSRPEDIPASLKTVTVTNDLDINGAFQNCATIETIYITVDDLKTTGYTTFYGCTSLKNIVLPESLEEIGQQAFEGCTSLSEITIPAGVTKIGMYAFAGCEALGTIRYSGTIAQWKTVMLEGQWDNEMGDYTIVCTDGIYVPTENGVPSNVQVGDTVTFGSYEQDNDTSNGTEAIEWLVLDVKDGKALVISKYALDSHQYYSSYAPMTWESSTLRTWLNDDFLKSAFTAEEQAKIVRTTVTADANPKYATTPGNETEDWIFALSISEAQTYFGSSADRKCQPTAYALSVGVAEEYGNCKWWMRSPGFIQNYAAHAWADGNIHFDGAGVDAYLAVRPSMWVELNP